ncbi:MAG: 16S rRNA (guanine(527)-N(7))-methyltransferase RsmG [Woeseia sp.]|nr:16S rRNA (guanine(527)-N(7))-methyltransferase RsmG [Woeseia sp.]|tara:strand:+ start:15236 stop:15859 length:624 start_codon:yes stop_codon:yes gene_type:complete
MTTEIQLALKSLDDSFSCEEEKKLSLLMEELERWNKKINLTAIRDRSKMISLHLLDSLVAAPLIKGGTVLDVGTGPGFPGLPLAIVQQHRHFTLLDSNNKKIMFVEHMTRLLGLNNVSAIKMRSEDYAPGLGFDTVIARAVASLPKLLKIAGHLVGEDGVFISLKGRYPVKELEEVKEIKAKWSHIVKELYVPGFNKGSRHAVLLRR